MGIGEMLLQSGYVPAGQVPNRVQVQGNDPLSRLSAALDTYQAKYKADELAKQQAITRQLDMYKTLRDSGYTPSDAYDAIKKNKLPAAAGGQPLAEQKTQAEIDNIKASTELKVATADKVTKAGLADNQKTLISSILNKIAEDQPLTPGEQKVYDEVIRKYGNKSALEEALGGGSGSAASAAAGQAPAANTDTTIQDYVPMTDPQGNKKKVHKEDVAKALSVGWTKR